MTEPGSREMHLAIILRLLSRGSAFVQVRSEPARSPPVLPDSCVRLLLPVLFFFFFFRLLLRSYAIHTPSCFPLLRNQALLNDGAVSSLNELLLEPRIDLRDMRLALDAITKLAADPAVAIEIHDQVGTRNQFETVRCSESLARSYSPCPTIRQFLRR